MLKYEKKYLGKCYLLSSGGLGDIILDYITNKNYLKIIDAHKKYDISVDIVLKTTNKHSKDIFKNNIFFKNIIFENFEKENNTKFDIPKFQDLTKNLELEKKIMPIFLTLKEQIKLEQITKPYVVLHPFAGEDFRSWNNKVDLKKIIQKIIKCGYNVVMIGGSHFREAKIQEQRNYREEFFNYKQKNFLNLIDKISVALCLAIVQKSNFFIGASSCYLTAAWCYNTKSMAIVPSHKFLPQGNWWGEVIHQKSTVVTFDELIILEELIQKFLQ